MSSTQFAPLEKLRAAKLNRALDEARATPSSAGHVFYQPENAVGLVPRTVERKLTNLGYDIRDWGGGVGFENNSPAFNRIFADVLRRDPVPNSLEFTIWLSSDPEGTYQIADPLVFPRGCKIASRDGRNTGVIKTVSKVWTSPALYFPEDACHIEDCQLECMDMQAGSEPGIVVDGGTLTLNRFNLNTGPVPGLRGINNARINISDMICSAGFFGLNATPGMGIIELLGGTDFFCDGLRAFGSGTRQQCAAILARDVEILYLTGHVNVSNMWHLLSVPTVGTEIARIIRVDGFTASNNMEPGQYVIDIKPENSSRVRSVYIGPHSVEAGGAGAVNVHGWGFCDEVRIGPGFVNGATDYAYRMLNADVFTILSPHITGGKDGIRFGGNTPSGVDRPVSYGAIIGGKIGAIGDRAANTGTGISIASQAHGVVYIDGVDCRGNGTNDIINPTDPLNRLIKVVTSAGIVSVND